MAYEDLIAVLAPEFVNDPRMPTAIELALTAVNPEHCYHDWVVVLLAAHTLSMGGRGGSGGVVASKSEGGMSISYSSSSASSDLLSSTGYGSEILRLNQLCYGMSARTAWYIPEGSGTRAIEPPVWPYTED